MIIWLLLVLHKLYYFVTLLQYVKCSIYFGVRFADVYLDYC